MISGCVKCQYDFRLCGVQESPMGFFFHYYMLTLVSNNVHQISAVNFSSIFNNAFPCLVVFLLTVEVEPGSPLEESVARPYSAPRERVWDMAIEQLVAQEFN